MNSRAIHDVVVELSHSIRMIEFDEQAFSYFRCIAGTSTTEQ